MFAFHKIIASICMATCLLAVTPAPSSGTFIISINNQSGSVPAIRRDARLMVALEPIAARLGIPLRHMSGAVRLQVDGTWITMMPNDMTVREGASPMMTLTSSPRRNGSQTFVDADDVANLLDVDMTRNAHVLTVSQKKAHTAEPAFAVHEIAVPKTTPAPSPTPRPDAIAAIPPGKRLVGHAAVSIIDQANSHYTNASFEGGGPNLRASLYASAVAGARPTIGGSVRVGNGTKHVDVGAVTDPLFGEIFANGGGNGVEIQTGAGTVFSFSNAPFAGRRSVAIGKRAETWSDDLALVRGLDGSSQFVAGFRTASERHSWYFSKEVVVGEHGIAAGLHYRSTGRLYTEARLGFAGSGLPLGPGDAPVQLTEGFDFTKALGIRAGLSKARGYIAQSLIQLYGQRGLWNYSASHYASGNALSLGFNGASQQGSLDFMTGSGSTTIAAQAATNVRRGSLNFDGYVSGTSGHDVSLGYTLRRDGPSATLGIETVASGSVQHFGPTLGLALPMGAGLSATAEIHPLIRGNGLRVNLQKTILGGVRLPQQPVVQYSISQPLTTAAFLLIDGAQGPLLPAGSTKLSLPLGSHYISLRSADGHYGSPEQRIVDGIGAFSTMMWPIREVRGKVELNPALRNVFPVAPSLTGVTVVLQPMNLAVQTDENGEFEIPAQPIDPASTIRVQADGLPDGLAPGVAQPITKDGKVHLELVSSKRIEKVKF